jgi:hypothetical protein
VADRVRGATAALLIATAVTATLAAAADSSIGHVVFLVAGNALVVGVTAITTELFLRSKAGEQVRARAAAPSRLRAPGPRGRRRRRIAFLVTLAAAAALTLAVLRAAAWNVLDLLPGLMLGALVVARRLTGPAPGSSPRRTSVALGSIVLLPVLVVAYSLGVVLEPPGPDPLTVRTVEWIRDHGGAGAVNGIEHWWYTNHPPPVGGTPAELKHAAMTAPPPAAVGAPTLNSTTTVPTGPTPAELAPVPSPTGQNLNGEGVWITRSGTPTHPAVATTLVRPDPVHTSFVVGLLRIDPSRTRMALVPGTEQPGGGAAGNGSVPAADRPDLVAAFNAGFRMKEANGGWYSDGHTASPLRAGVASLVLRNDGRAEVGVWGRDVTMDPHVTAVRQNLALIVDGGQPVAGINSENNRLWGATLGHRLAVWRSGVGVTADGAIIYAGGPALSVETLAKTLISAGCVRAMELDINTQWVDGYTFTNGAAGPVGTPLVDTMRYPGDHYLNPQSRDFVAVMSVPAPGAPAHGHRAP